jgi:hypothetical protein
MSFLFSFFHFSEVCTGFFYKLRRRGGGFMLLILGCFHAIFSLYGGFIMPLTQTVEIPENRRIHLDFEAPVEIPTGSTARFDIIWFPQKKKSDLDAVIKELQELCKDSNISVDSFREERRRDLELEESKYRRLYGDSN